MRTAWNVSRRAIIRRSLGYAPRLSAVVAYLALYLVGRRSLHLLLAQANNIKLVGKAILLVAGAQAAESFTIATARSQNAWTMDVETSRPRAHPTISELKCRFDLPMKY